MVLTFSNCQDRPLPLADSSCNDPTGHASKHWPHSSQSPSLEIFVVFGVPKAVNPLVLKPSAKEYWSSAQVLRTSGAHDTFIAIPLNHPIIWQFSEIFVSSADSIPRLPRTGRNNSEVHRFLSFHRSYSH